MAETLGQRGVLRVVSPAQLETALQKQDQERVAAQITEGPVMSNLAGFIRTQFEMMKQHRNDAMSGWSERLLIALRAFNGQYDAAKIAEIRKFGGSEVYARIIAMKCRGASSLLRDVYLAPDRPWGLSPPQDPDVPPQIVATVQQLVQAEIAAMSQAGNPPDPTIIRDRTLQLMEAARMAAKKRATQQKDC